MEKKCWKQQMFDFQFYLRFPSSNCPSHVWKSYKNKNGNGWKQIKWFWLSINKWWKVSGVSCKGVPQGHGATISHMSALQECPTSVSYESVLQQRFTAVAFGMSCGCHAKPFLPRVLQKRPTSVPRNRASQGAGAARTSEKSVRPCHAKENRDRKVDI